MVALTGENNAERSPAFEGIPRPVSPSVVLLAPAMHGAPVLSPKQYLYTYSDEEWEDFTVEWVRALNTPYVLVTRMGGAGDRGADVAACLTRQGTKGEWHCYQCKHYEEALRPADAWPEVVKIFLAKVLGVYELPTRYVFVAPKISASLTRYLANPATLKTEFFKAWDKPGSKLREGLSADDRSAVEDLTRRTGFSMFEARDLDWILELHAKTPNHTRRFPTALKPRPPVQLPPSEQRAHEAIYVQQLLAAYNEKYGFSCKHCRRPATTAAPGSTSPGSEEASTARSRCGFSLARACRMRPTKPSKQISSRLWLKLRNRSMTSATTGWWPCWRQPLATSPTPATFSLRSSPSGTAKAYVTSSPMTTSWPGARRSRGESSQQPSGSRPSCTCRAR